MRALAVTIADKQADKHADRRPQRADEHVEVKEQKCFLVGQPNAVVHPRTVVVHLHHTAAAHATVMRPWWLHRIASLAYSLVFEAHLALFSWTEQEVDVDSLVIRPLTLSWMRFIWLDFICMSATFASL